MIVCLCHNISSGDIARAAKGCCSFEALQDDLLVGTACGCCESCARETYLEHQDPAAALASLPQPGPRGVSSRRMPS